MSANTENKPQDCKYCKTSIYWDLTIQEKRKWRETISKEVHTFDKCKKNTRRTTSYRITDNKTNQSRCKENRGC